jgi:hypothetical protein
MNKGGGNIVFQTGEGLTENGVKWPDGDFIFKFGVNEEFMRLHSDGRVTIQGVLVEDAVPDGLKAKVIYSAFKKWLETAMPDPRIGGLLTDGAPTVGGLGS